MKKYFFMLCLLGVVSTLFAQETRTENNGNLILEDIPAIPGSIKAVSYTHLTLPTKRIV